MKTIGGYAAYADQMELVTFVKGMKRKLTETRLVQAEKHAEQVFKTALNRIT
jgi:hypothetical protein